MRRSNDYKPPFFHDDVTFAVVILVVVLFILFLSSCSFFPKLSGPEPKWSPTIYRYKPAAGKCAFYSPSIKHLIDCDEPIIQDMILLDVNDLSKLAEKFNACERWQ